MTRRFRWAMGMLLIAVWGFAFTCFAADLGIVAGDVRDGDGKPLSEVSVTLTSRQVPAATFKTKTDSSGQYRLTVLAVGEYVLVADAVGYVATAPTLVRVLADGVVTANLTLIRSVQEGGTSAATSTKPRLEFESSGIRGLIDPGGYSASSAGAASGLLRGIADVKRTDRGYGASAAKDWPCGLEAQLRQGVAKNPASAEANRRLGQFYVAHDEPAKATASLQRALAIDPHDDVAALQLAIALLQAGDFAHALELLSPLALEASGRPVNAEVHQILARADEGLGQFREAAEQYRIAARTEPSEESSFGIGYELMLTGSLAPALEAFANGVQRYPRSIPMRIGLGTTQFLQGRTPEAVHSFLDATDIDPTDARPYGFLVGTLSLTRDESDRVSASFKRYLERRPDSAFANYAYALALSFDKGVPDSSRIESLLRHANQLDPNVAKAHLLLADTLAQRMDYEDAVPEYEAAIRLDNGLKEAHYRLAMAYRRINQPDLSAREMQIFKMAAVTKPDAVDLAQFVSVMSTPDQHASQELQCVAGPQ